MRFQGLAISEITQLLERARNGEPEQIEIVFAMLYSQLRSLAAARLGGPDQTLTPTALVHEAFLNLTANATLSLADRKHFFACAARSMRFIVVDHARRRHAARRGSGLAQVTLDEALVCDESGAPDSDLLSLDQAPDRLDTIDPRRRQVVELHFFAGLTFNEIAELLECSRSTAKREWERARSFLYAELDEA